MRYAHSLNLPQLIQAPLPRRGTAIIVGGAPSVKDNLEITKIIKARQTIELIKIPIIIELTNKWLKNIIC